MPFYFQTAYPAEVNVDLDKEAELRRYADSMLHSPGNVVKKETINQQKEEPRIRELSRV